MQKSKNDSYEVMIVAAEASSSLYAQRILEQWKLTDEPVHSFGIGSQAMVDLGFEALGRSEELAVMGLQEVLGHFPLIYKTFYKLVEEAKRRKPAFVLLLDYPDFNMRLAAKLKKELNVPIIYYISPQIWAWRQSRVYKIKKTIDRVLLLFPFEVDFYQKFSVEHSFVGHPLIDELESSLFDEHHVNELKTQFGFDPSKRVVGLMPGSRKSEIKFLLATQLQAAELLHAKNPDTQFALLLAPGLKREVVEPYLAQSQVPVRIISSTPTQMIATCDELVVASGTATLMVGLLEKPMVVVYKMNAFTAFMAKRLVKSVKFFAMVNLVLNRLLVKEFFQEAAHPAAIADELERIQNDSGYRQTMIRGLQEMKIALGAKGATHKVIEVLKGYRPR